MSTTATASNLNASNQHKLTGDVHLLLLNPDDQILFGRRQNTGFEDGAWHIPSGHLEAGESVVQALIREAKEEVGIDIVPEDVEFSHIMHNSSSGGRAAFFLKCGGGAGCRKTVNRRSVASWLGFLSRFCPTI